MANRTRKALDPLPRSGELDVSHSKTKNLRRALHRKLYHDLVAPGAVMRKRTTLATKYTRQKPIYESRQILADWEKKFAKSRGKISGSQMAAINKLPLHIKKQVLALSRTYATLGRKDASVDPGRLTFNREIIKAKGEEERAKRQKRQSKAEFERDLDAQADKIKSGLGWLLARNEIRKRKLKEGSDGIMKEESDKETMMNYIKKTSEDAYGCTDHDPKHYNKMAREYVMGKYKDGYLKKEAAMQQMGMIGVPKDEILKMFDVETELDEDVPWEPNFSHGKGYKHKGKPSKSSRAAKFLDTLKRARLGLKNKPKQVKEDALDEVKDGGYSWDTHDYLAGLDSGKIKHKPAYSAHIPARGYFNSEKEYRAISRRESGEHKGVDRKNKAGTLTSIGNKTRNKRSEALKKLFKKMNEANEDALDEGSIRRHLLGREHTRPSLQRVKPSSNETKAYSIGRVAKITKHKDGHWLVKSRYNEGRDKDKKHTLKSAMNLARELFYAHRERLESQR